MLLLTFGYKRRLVGNVLHRKSTKNNLEILLEILLLYLALTPEVFLYLFLEINNQYWALEHLQQG